MTNRMHREEHNFFILSKLDENWWSQIWLSNNEHEHEQEKRLFVSFVFEKFLVRLELFTNVHECNTQTVTYSMWSVAFVCYICSRTVREQKILVRVRSSSCSSRVRELVRFGSHVWEPPWIASPPGQISYDLAWRRGYTVEITLV